MAIDKKAYALANGYTDETVIGGGAIKGKNCTISKIEDIDGGHRITFGWTLDNGTTKSQTLDVKDGVQGDKGDKGEQGIAGKDGNDGTTYTPSIGTVTTVESNVEASATVSVNEETKEAIFNFNIPKGKDGDRNADTVNGHTVKSDVPENAVFTDTVYDDTEIKAEISKKADKSYVDNNFATMDKIGLIPIEANRTITFSNDYTEISVYRCGYSNIRAHIEIDALCNITSVAGWVQDMGIVLSEGYRPSENMSISAWCSSDTESHTPIILMIGADGKLSGYIGQSHTSINRLNITVTYFK